MGKEIQNFKGVSKKGPTHALGSRRGRQFLVFGRRKPTQEGEQTQVCVSKVFAPNEAFARSHFWKLNARKHKLKKSRGEIIKVQEVHEKNTTAAKNFGIFLKYRSRTGIHNIYKEFRDVSLAGAIDQMYNEMGGNYKIDAEKVEIINTTVLNDDQLGVRNPRCLQWNNTEAIKYPLWKKTARRTNSKYNTMFAAKRPVVMKTGKSE